MEKKTELKIRFGRFGSYHTIYAHSVWQMFENNTLLQAIPRTEGEEPTFREGDPLMIDDQKFHIIKRNIRFNNDYVLFKYTLAEGEWKPPKWIKIGELSGGEEIKPLEENKDELKKLMLTPSKWRLFPILKLKRLMIEIDVNNLFRHWDDYGIMFAVSPYSRFPARPNTVFFVDPSDIKPSTTIDDLPYQKYDTVDLLIDDGWILNTN